MAQPPDDGRINWSEVYRRHARWLRTVVASRLQEPASVDDVLQQVALAAVGSERPPPTEELAGPWLYRVAIRLCLQHRRRCGRLRRLEDRLRTAGDAADFETTQPLDWLLHAERNNSVRAALSELNELDRQVLLLKYTEDWTYQQLSEHLGVSIHSVEHRLHAARNRLRTRLAPMAILDAPT